MIVLIAAALAAAAPAASTADVHHQEHGQGAHRHMKDCCGDMAKHKSSMDCCKGAAAKKMGCCDGHSSEQSSHSHK